MNQKKSKPKPKQQPWNSFAYLAGLAKKKESVTIYLNGHTIQHETQLKWIIIDGDNWTPFSPITVESFLFSSML